MFDVLETGDGHSLSDRLNSLRTGEGRGQLNCPLIGDGSNVRTIIGLYTLTSSEEWSSVRVQENLPAQFGLH